MSPLPERGCNNDAVCHTMHGAAPLGHQRVRAPFRQLFPMLGKRSFSQLSRERNPTRCILFVHGFTGHPLKTWREFDRPIEAAGWWGASDLVFFGYASTQEEIRYTSETLVEFLHNFLPRRSAEVACLAALEPPTHDYKELVLVGHSQGGLVVRHAVLQALWELTSPESPSGAWEDEATANLIANARVRLFAPAIFGARPAGLKEMALQSFGLGTVARMVLGGSPSYQEMQQGSSLLTYLAESTTERAQAHPKVSSLRARIAWATKDRVVMPNGQYTFDPASSSIGGTDHGSVCKPRGPHTAQVELVRRPF